MKLLERTNTNGHAGGERSIDSEWTRNTNTHARAQNASVCVYTCEKEKEKWDDVGHVRTHKYTRTHTNIDVHAHAHTATNVTGTHVERRWKSEPTGGRTTRGKRKKGAARERASLSPARAQNLLPEAFSTGGDPAGVRHYQLRGRVNCLRRHAVTHPCGERRHPARQRHNRYLALRQNLSKCTSGRGRAPTPNTSTTELRRTSAATERRAGRRDAAATAAPLEAASPTIVRLFMNERQPS